MTGALSCDDVRSLLGGYVLHALEPGETERVDEHLATCSDCSREYARLAPLPTLLGAAGGPEPAELEPPPPTLEEAVLDRFARERPTARRPRVLRWLARPLPVAGAAAAAAAAVTLLLSDALDSYDPAPAKVYGAHLHGPPSAPRAYAYARLSSFSAGTRVQLRVTGVRPLPGAVYELWCVYPNGSKVSAGTFRLDDAGRAELDMTTAARVGDYHRLSVERRLPGRGGERVLAGSIAY
ncbi:MAG TPA: anti-sigma factor [Thermoleophilaceae bacterium]